MNPLLSYKKSKEYTNYVFSGIQTIAGKNCTIKSISPNYNDNSKIISNTVTFEWTNDDGVKRENSITIENGLDGKDGKDLSTFDSWNNYKQYDIGDFVIYDNEHVMYKCINNHISSENFINDIDNWSIYLGYKNTELDKKDYINTLYINTKLDKNIDGKEYTSYKSAIEYAKIIATENNPINIILPTGIITEDIILYPYIYVYGKNTIIDGYVSSETYATGFDIGDIPKTSVINGCKIKKIDLSKTVSFSNVNIICAKDCIFENINQSDIIKSSSNLPCSIFANNCEVYNCNFRDINNIDTLYLYFYDSILLNSEFTGAYCGGNISGMGNLPFLQLVNCNVGGCILHGGAITNTSMSKYDKNNFNIFYQEAWYDISSSIITESEFYIDKNVLTSIRNCVLYSSVYLFILYSENCVFNLINSEIYSSKKWILNSVDVENKKVLNLSGVVGKFDSLNPNGDKTDKFNNEYLSYNLVQSENINYIGSLTKNSDTVTEMYELSEKLNDIVELGTSVDLSNYFNKQDVNNLLQDKVDKIVGKTLSSEDYTIEEKNKLAKFTEDEDGNLYYNDIIISNYYEHEIWVGTTEELDSLTEEEKSNYKLFITTDGQDTMSVEVDDEVTQNSDNPVSSNGVYNALENKVDKENGRGLSTNDFTDEDKSKLDSIQSTMRLVDSILTVEELPTDPNNGDTYIVGESPNLELWTYTVKGWANRPTEDIDLTQFLKIRQDNSNIGKYLKVGASGSIEFVNAPVGTGGDGGVSSYILIADKPSIDGTTLNGEMTKEDLGIMSKDTYDSNGNGIVDKAEVAMNLLDADQALPNQVYRCDSQGNLGFSYLPINTDSVTPIEPMRVSHMSKDVPEIIDLQGKTTCIITQVSEEITGDRVENELLDSFTSTNGMFKSDNIEIDSVNGVKIKDGYILDRYTLDSNGFKEYDLSDFVNIKLIEMEVK